jgi:hypothetical protein
MRARRSTASRAWSRTSCVPAGMAATSDAAAAASAKADFANVPTRSRTCLGLRPHSRANCCQSVEIELEIETLQRTEIFQLKQTIEEQEAKGRDPLGDLARSLELTISEKTAKTHAWEPLIGYRSFWPIVSGVAALSDFKIRYLKPLPLHGLSCAHSVSLVPPLVESGTH